MDKRKKISGLTKKQGLGWVKTPQAEEWARFWRKGRSGLTAFGLPADLAAFGVKGKGQEPKAGGEEDSEQSAEAQFALMAGFLAAVGTISHPHRASPN